MGDYRYRPRDGNNGATARSDSAVDAAPENTFSPLVPLVMRLRPTPFALCLALVACRDPRAVSADDPRVRYEARTLTDWRGRVRFAWPRSAVHLRFRGAGLSARLTDTPYEDSLRDTDIVGVEVDGGPMRRLALRDGTYDYALAAGLAPGEHTLRLTKLTEAEVGTVRVDGLTRQDVPLHRVVRSAPASRPRIAPRAGIGRRIARGGHEAHLSAVAPVIRAKQDLQRLLRRDAAGHQVEPVRAKRGVRRSLRRHGADPRLRPRDDRPDGEEAARHRNPDLAGRRIGCGDREGGWIGRRGGKRPAREGGKREKDRGRTSC